MLTQYYVIVARKGTDWVDLAVMARDGMAACEAAEREAATMENDMANLPDYFARYVRPMGADYSAAR